MPRKSEEVELQETNTTTATNQSAKLEDALYIQNILVESDDAFGNEKSVAGIFMFRKYGRLNEAKAVLEKLAVKYDSSEDISNYPHRDRIYRASRVGKFDELETLLNDFRLSPKACLLLLNELDTSKRAHLHYAARHNNIRVTKLLLNKGADPNIIGSGGLTPLHYAARYCYDKGSKYQGKSCLSSNSTTYRTVISELIASGAKFNAKDNRGMTPLDYAAMGGNAFATRELLKSSKIDESIYGKHRVRLGRRYSPESDCHEDNPLEAWVMKEHDSFYLKKLTVLHIAAIEGSKEVVLLLLESFEERQDSESLKQYIDEGNSDGATALDFAVSGRHFEVVKVLLQKGADPYLNICETYTNSDQLLHIVAARGNVELVKYLLEQGVEINTVDCSGDTPLHKVSEFNAAEVVEILLENGSDIEARSLSRFNRTPLLTAVVQGHVEVVEKLLDAGANIDAVDERQQDALLWAAIHGRCDVLRLLLKHGAEPENVDKDGRTALHVAAERGDVDIAEVLVNHSKFIVNVEDKNARTPLSLAAEEGHYKVMNVLLDAGAFLDTRKLSWTPLHFAAFSGWKRCCQMLLDAHCTVDAFNEEKVTPLHLAAYSGHKDVVKLLLKYSANIAHWDVRGRNCLDLAIQERHKEVALEILSNIHWKTALRKNMRWSTDSALNTPLRRMIRYMPDIAELVLDKCITKRLYDDDLSYNYEFIDDTFGHDVLHLLYKNRSHFSSQSEERLYTEFNVYYRGGLVREGVTPYIRDREFLKRNHPLMLMVTFGREELLNHPLCKMLVKHKRTNYVGYVYCGNFLIYLSFLISLTSYVITSIPPCPDSTAYSDNCVTRNFTCQPHIGNLDANIDKGLLKQCQISLYFFAALNLTKEIYQAYQNRLHYINLENFLELTCYICAFVFAADLTDCSSHTGIREVWQWHLGSVLIFASWMVLLAFIRKLPIFGIYVVMFWQILITFLKFSVVFILFILAFAVAFFTVLQNQDPFEKVEDSIMKTSVMMIGEMEFDEIFNNPDNKVYFQGPAYFFFVLFLLFMSVILMNMLIGLAVDDIKEIQKKASLKRLGIEVELFLSVEKVLPTNLLRKCIVRYQTREEHLFTELLQRIVRPFRNTVIVPEEHLKHPEDETILKKGKVKNNGSKLEEQLKDIQESINLLQKDMKNIQSIVQLKQRQ